MDVFWGLIHVFAILKIKLPNLNFSKHYFRLLKVSKFLRIFSNAANYMSFCLTIPWKIYSDRYWFIWLIIYSGQHHIERPPTPYPTDATHKAVSSHSNLVLNPTLIKKDIKRNCMNVTGFIRRKKLLSPKLLKKYNYYYGWTLRIAKVSTTKFLEAIQFGIKIEIISRRYLFQLISIVGKNCIHWYMDNVKLGFDLPPDILILN